MATIVFVQRDGIVNHSHDGVKGMHNPATKHANAGLHAANAADAPTNLDSLNASQRKQYAQALAGKSFYGLYAVAVKARRDEAGDNWGYGKRPAAPVQTKAEAIAEQLDALEDAVRGITA